MPPEFHWLRPEWLLGIPVVVLFALYFARRQFGTGAWQQVVTAELAPYVLSRSATRGADSRWWLFAITGIIALLAMAGPAWERIEQPVFRSEQALVIAVDLSRSMDAQDVAPSRLLRARLKVLDMLKQRGSGQTALIVYSANAFTVTPLTTDNDTIASLVNSLSTDIMPSRGSYPIAAIKKGRALLEQAGAGFGEVLLITDGGTSPAAEEAARDLHAAGYTLSVLGVGTAQGAPIPRQSGGFVTDQSGQMAVPRFEERSLRRLAEAGGGEFAVLSADTRDIDRLLSGEVVAGKRSDDSQTTDQWREEGPWLLLFILPLAALAFRRGWVLLLLIAVIPAAPQAEAALWDDLWWNKNQQAERLLEQGEPAAAADLFADPEWEAIARYKNQEFSESAAGFSQQEHLRGLYNLGNALAQQGELESALDAYEEVLESEPGHADAEYNRDLIRQLLDQQEQQQQQQQQAGEQQQDGDSGEAGEPGEQGEQQPSGESQNEEPGEDSEAAQREDEDAEEDLEALQQELEKAAQQAGEDDQSAAQQLSQAELEALRQQQEQEQAMEQWLRRIPNDPGGLLRRKFRYQYQRGDVDQDGNRLWPDDTVQPW